MGVMVERVADIRPPNENSPVILKQMGENFFEIRYNEKSQGGLIRKINNDYYEVVIGKDADGNEIVDVREYNRTAETRADNLASVSRSMRDLRDIINCNVTEPERCLWVTLTYRENMRDPKRHYRDIEKFNKRLRYFLRQSGLPEMEYIYCVEPQARGAFHAHCILIFDAAKAPFIPNDEMAKIWRHGFTKTKSLKGIANPGLYLTAYLSDMEIEKALRMGVIIGDGVKEVNTTGEDGASVSKSIVKGARLHLYPAGMRLFRVSRDIKRPIVTKMSEGDAMKIIGDAPLVFERTIKVKVSEVDHVLNTINYRQYNRNCQSGEL